MKHLNLIWILCLFAQGGLAQSFGQNKVQYNVFDWSFISSTHFDIYYYQDEKHIAKFTAEEAENSYEQISKHLRWTLKDRVSIIVYLSHNDFQQSNVTQAYMVEGVGGVTELYKNRVVIPFEGNYEQFRHVIHHELVHAMINDMVYGGSLQNMVSRQVKTRLPLWANEGLAEFLSMNWDTEADMILRDLAINEYIPAIEELDYFLAYKGGQSVWRFIAQKYGREKIGEIFWEIHTSQSTEKGFKRVLGMDFEDLTNQWHKYLKKEYWPDVKDRDEIEDIAKRLTDHEKEKNFMNLSPALSPDGSRIAVLSDRLGHTDIYLLDAIDGTEIKRLVKGNRSLDFEELKFLQPGISWAPDNERIVFAAKSGKQDALYIIDVKTLKREKIPFDLDGIFTAAWNPVKNQIAFVGNDKSSSDLYIYDLDTETLTNLTNDFFADFDPAWNQDGTEIAFVSSRGDQFQTDRLGMIDSEFEMVDHDYGQRDIYTLNIESGSMSRITSTKYHENGPIWIDQSQKLFFTSDRNGVWNLVSHDLTTGSAETVTNVLTGIFQPSLSSNGELMVFSGYTDRGWDVFTLTNPSNLETKDIPVTGFITSAETDGDVLADLRQDKNRSGRRGRGRDFARYIFAPDYVHNNQDNNEEADVDLFTGLDSLRTEDGGYISQSYKTKFSLDIATGYPSYNTMFGASGMAMFAFSDIMGDHQIILGTELVLTLKDSDYYLSYAYLKNRTNLYLSGFHIANLFDAGIRYYPETGFLNQLVGRLRHYGLSGYVSRPFNRFNRLESGISLNFIDYDLFELDSWTNTTALDTAFGFSILTPHIGWIYDNSVNGYTGPVDGFRTNSTIRFSPGIGSKTLNFTTFSIDLRKYQRISRRVTLAGRLTLGASIGNDPQKYYLGGDGLWFAGLGETNGKQDPNQWQQNLLVDSSRTFLEDIYLSEYVFPLRGARFAERYGKNVALANIELRFPFIDYIALGSGGIFGNIHGILFMDIGAAWDSMDEFNDQSMLQDKYGTSIPDSFSPVFSTFGVGVKIPFLYLFRIDAAWDIEPGFTTSRPQWIFSMGYDW
ncbi:MAG: hypothetical protein HOD97_01180 [Candidatus Marinimicrobia bacterium]|nr:hypothetical protein [Candidatus Neomarinimicrobiota bacterium]MBT3618089.1 hypothetical protein [Candidatus Neomarinimicrobiota bacterium]MBT3828454.1 hypothetical protein [Candidatus Neomarinimicrobiota bacterium]MBT3998075.1 hypothetical protein [Candidatus Neomarinimicrobiota bacterium]MBT4280221.1 hypothetical protein [Candidatus Neomarinimicrobiota bacterium]